MECNRPRLESLMSPCLQDLCLGLTKNRDMFALPTRFFRTSGSGNVTQQMCELELRSLIFRIVAENSSALSKAQP